MIFISFVSGLLSCDFPLHLGPSRRVGQSGEISRRRENAEDQTRTIRSRERGADDRWSCPRIGLPRRLYFLDPSYPPRSKEVVGFKSTELGIDSLGGRDPPRKSPLAEA